MRRNREPDFLDELIDKSTRRNPQFPALMKAAEQRRRLLQSLAEERRRSGVSQTQLAARLQTSQSAIARLEASGDAKLSTIDHFAIAVGKTVQWRIREAPRSDRRLRVRKRSI